MFNYLRKGIAKILDLLGSKRTLDRLSKANGVQWYEHVLWGIMMMC